MNLITQTATTLLGLLAGGMVLIATGLVPYWRAIDPSEFTNAFAPSLPTVGGTMIVLTVLGTGMIVIVAGLALRKSQPNRFWLAGSALAALIMLATLPRQHAFSKRVQTPPRRPAFLGPVQKLLH